MTIRLSAAEAAAFSKVQETLLSVFGHHKTEEWLRHATREMKSYLGADKGFLLLDPTGKPTLFTEGLSRQEVLTYPREVVALDKRFALWQRQLALGAWSRRTLNRPHMAAYLRSTYYNEYVLPVRAHDAMGITSRVASSGPIATAMFHHDSLTGRQFGERGLALLKLLEPAFRAAVTALHAYGAFRSTLLRVVDHIGTAAVMYDRRGMECHRNPSARRLLELPKVGPLISTRAAALAKAMLTKRAFEGPSPFEAIPTKNGYFIVSGVPLEGLHHQLDCAVVVTIQGPPSRTAISSDQARALGLSRRQGEIASLMAQGWSDKQIAQQLGLSIHTVKRHVEAVLARLAISSRREVLAAVQVDAFSLSMEGEGNEVGPARPYARRP